MSWPVPDIYTGLISAGNSIKVDSHARRIQHLVCLFLLRYGLILCSWGGCLAPGLAQAQCPQAQTDTLLWENFEAGGLSDWTPGRPSDGGQWQQDEGSFGYFSNPGQGTWLYLNDEQHNQIGQAILTSPVFDGTQYPGELRLSFQLNFQRFEEKGRFWVAAWDGSQWSNLLVLEEEFAGEVVLVIEPLTRALTQIRFGYDDEGSWGWGMGLDEICLQGRSASCGNSLCESGENPQSCPDDCPDMQAAPSAWVPLGQDLLGQPVSYRSLTGGTACDDCSERVSLGFAFDFFGEIYDQVFINANGNLSLDRDFVKFHPEPFCLTGPKLIAPFFADLDLRKGGEVRYWLDPQRQYLIVTWYRVAYFGCEAHCELRNTFQVILTNGSIRQIGNFLLPAGSNIIFNYRDMNWTGGAASGGNQGFGGASATVGINDGESIRCQDYGTFDHPGYAYYGNLQDDHCPPNAISHLDYRSICFCGEKGELAQAEGLLSFTGKALEAGICLDWELDQVNEIEYFQIERAVEGGAFEAVSMLNPIADDSTRLGQFRWVDSTVQQARMQYKLVIFYETGEVYHSEPIRIVASNEITSGNRIQLLSFGPNPFVDEVILRFSVNEPAPVQYVLTDMTGRQLRRGQWEAHVGENQQRLQMPGLSPGQYVLSLRFMQTKTHLNLIKNN